MPYEREKNGIYRIDINSTLFNKIKRQVGRLNEKHRIFIETVVFFAQYNLDRD